MLTLRCEFTIEDRACAKAEVTVERHPDTSPEEKRVCDDLERAIENRVARFFNRRTNHDMKGARHDP